jgi:hypothetical protein
MEFSISMKNTVRVATKDLLNHYSGPKTTGAKPDLETIALEKFRSDSTTRLYLSQKEK